MRPAVLLLLMMLGVAPAVANPSADEAERPRFTIRCDYDGWTCADNFPAISRDHLTIAYAVTRDDKVVVEFISVATSHVLRRETAFEVPSKIPTTVRVARLHRELRDFRAMKMSEDDQLTFTRGTITLKINYCEGECRTSYRVTRRPR